MRNFESQTLNSKQAPNSNSKMTKIISFGISAIGVYLGFNAWKLVPHVSSIFAETGKSRLSVPARRSAACLREAPPPRASRGPGLGEGERFGTQA